MSSAQKSSPLSRGSGAMLALGRLLLGGLVVSLLPQPVWGQGFDPGRPAKEYIYSGSRLVSLEEPPSPTQFPDLVVTDISWSPASPVTGSAVTFSATVKNQGNAATPQGIAVGVLFTVDGSSTVTWAGGYTTSLTAGASVTLTASGGNNGGISTWPATVSTHTVEAWADDDNRISESNESNNKRTETFTVLNPPPTVSITSPANGATFTAPANGLFPDITITAYASDPGGSIDRVEFYAGSALIGTDRTSPYSVTWARVPLGSYSITATAIDNSGLSTISAPVSVTVYQPNSSLFISQTVPLTMVGDQKYSVSISMKNTGATTWTAAAGYELGGFGSGGHTYWDSVRVNVPGTVTPGGTATFNFSVTAPPSAGLYNFQWTMLQEGAGWFGPSTPNVAVTVTPAPPAFTSFTFTPSSVYPDACATLSWSTTNASGVSIAGSGNFGPSGSLRVCVGSVPVTKVGTATGPGGTATASGTLSIRSCPGGICP